MPNKTQLIVYESDNGKIKLEVNLQNETLWLSQAQIAQLFGKGRTTITEHISNIFGDEELNPSETTMKLSNVGNADITTYKPTTLYNLDVILAVGYRVNSKIATNFRKWATQTLKEFIIKGYVMDDERVANNAISNKTGYFDELVERIRKIRVSEKLFYEKVKDIFSVTSYDYDSKSQEAKEFYSTVQNKFHYAVTEMTAAEIIVKRIDYTKENAGLTVFKGNQPTVDEAKIAKNYLLEVELKELYLISEQFLSFAELKAARQQTISMKDWLEKLDEMLKMNDLPVLQSKGSISHEDMEKYVKKEMEKYRGNKLDNKTK